MAQCPAHDDSRASLSIAAGDSQPVVMLCQASCQTVDVLAAVGLTLADISAAPDEHVAADGEWTPYGPAVAVYDYTDEDGNLLFQVCRTADKTFPQRAPDPSRRSGWRWKLGDTRRVPFHLPQLLAAARDRKTIWIAEGEKDVLALERHGCVATCNPGGAGKWQEEYDQYLAGAAEVRIVQDKDDAGRKHGLHVAEGLRRAGLRVQILEALAGKDAADHLSAGHGLDMFSVVSSEPSDRRREGGSERESRGPSQATMIRQLARERFRLIMGDDGKPYAVAVGGPNIARPLRGKGSLRSLLARLYADAHSGTVPSQSALTDALTALEGDAESAEIETVHLRVARHGDSIVLDLGTPDGRCIVVEPGSGWRRESRSPVLFRRTRVVGPLPDPVNGHGLDKFRELFNVDDYQWPVIVGWLTAALMPSIPHPILAILGEQGTAKSSAARMLITLIDPSGAPLRSQPRDVKNWATQASASWTICLDNLSGIPPWLSDALCKAVTGDGLVDRALFTDDDVNVLTFRRVIALTAIDTEALRGDLAERLLPVSLARIGDDSRRAEEDVAAAYSDERPEALGALLTLLSRVLAALPGVKLDRMPRMADFTRVLAALDKVTGWKSRDVYEATADDVAESVIESDLFAEAVRTFIGELPGKGQAEWEGNVGDLATLIKPDKPPRDWPTSPQAARTAMRRVAPALRMRGYTIEPLKRTNSGRPWLLAPPDVRDDSGGMASAKGAQPSSLSSPSSPDRFDLRERRDDAGDDRGTMQPSSPASSPVHVGSDLRERSPRDDGDDSDDASRIPPVPLCDRCGEPHHRYGESGRPCQTAAVARPKANSTQEPAA